MVVADVALAAGNRGSAVVRGLGAIGVVVLAAANGGSAVVRGLGAIGSFPAAGVEPLPDCVAAPADPPSNAAVLAAAVVAPCADPDPDPASEGRAVLRKEHSDPTTPAGSRHSCQPTVKHPCHTPSVTFPLGKG